MFRAAGAAGCSLNLSSCRPGGATHCYLKNIPIEILMFWGEVEERQHFKVLHTGMCLSHDLVKASLTCNGSRFDQAP